MFPGFTTGIAHEKLVLFCMACHHLGLDKPDVWYAHKLHDLLNDELVPLALREKDGTIREMFRKFRIAHVLAFGAFDEFTEFEVKAMISDYDDLYETIYEMEKEHPTPMEMASVVNQMKLIGGTLNV